MLGASYVLLYITIQTQSQNFPDYGHSNFNLWLSYEIVETQKNQSQWPKQRNARKQLIRECYDFEPTYRIVLTAVALIFLSFQRMRISEMCMCWYCCTPENSKYENPVNESTTSYPKRKFLVNLRTSSSFLSIFIIYIWFICGSGFL